MGKPYAVAAIITMVIGSGYILYTSGIFPIKFTSSTAAAVPVISTGSATTE